MKRLNSAAANVLKRLHYPLEVILGRQMTCAHISPMFREMAPNPIRKAGR